MQRSVKQLTVCFLALGGMLLAPSASHAQTPVRQANPPAGCTVNPFIKAGNPGSRTIAFSSKITCNRTIYYMKLIANLAACSFDPRFGCTWVRVGQASKEGNNVSQLQAGGFHGCEGNEGVTYRVRTRIIWRSASNPQLKDWAGADRTAVCQ